MIIIIIINNNIMTNIYENTPMTNVYKISNYKYSFIKKSKVNQAYNINIFYNSLIKSGFSTCYAFNESMKLLLIHNPLLELKELSETTLEIVNPSLKYYYDNNIDNHSHN